MLDVQGLVWCTWTNLFVILVSISQQLIESTLNHKSSTLPEQLSLVLCVSEREREREKEGVRERGLIQLLYVA